MSVCEHGQLARSCERCDDAREIAELRALLREVPLLLQHALHCGEPGMRCMACALQARIEEVLP